MTDKQFDRQLGEVLKNLEVPYNPSTWGLLERRMHATFAEEHPAPVDDVDKAVYHVLERLEAPYQTGHWQLLIQKMHVQALRIRRLRLAKAAEAALLLLLLVNLDKFVQVIPPSQNLPRKLHPDVPVAQAVPGAGNPHQRIDGVRVGRSGASSQNVAILPRETNPDALQDMAVVITQNVLSAGYLDAPTVTSVMNKLNHLTATPAKPVFAGHFPAEQLPLSGMFTAPPARGMALISPVPMNRLRQKGPVYLAIFGSADQNRVAVNKSLRTTDGYGAGVNIGYRKNGWGLETGVEYAHKNYTPKRKIEIYAGDLQQGYFGSYLAEVQAGVVSVPVRATRRLARVGKSSVHAAAGASASLVTEKRYDYGTVYYAPGNVPSGLSGPNPNTKPTLKQSGRGALENGGNWNENFYATLDAALRIEHPIGKGRYTAFIEPAFKHTVGGNGFGPNREPVNTISVKAGVMAFL